jgi:hypothetical protein
MGTEYSRQGSVSGLITDRWRFNQPPVQAPISDAGRIINKYPCDNESADRERRARLNEISQNLDTSVSPRQRPARPAPPPPDYLDLLQN